MLLRTMLPLVFDWTKATRTRWTTRGQDPDFGRASWVIGKSAGTLLNATRIPTMGLNTTLNDAHVWRIDYVTSDSRRRLLSCTGAVYRSLNPWSGRGPRPTIAFAPSTQGVAPHCDPSYSGTVGLDFRWPFDFVVAYEQPVINMFLALGCNVVLTDYPRDPEDNVQLYCDHPTAARALADAVRAAGSLGINANNLGLWGFSQGGGAVGAWLENPEYAPDLQPQAAFVGSPPADLVATLRHVDGAAPCVVVAYAIAGLRAYDDDIATEIDATLNDHGAELLTRSSCRCAAGAARHAAWESTASWTRAGIPVADTLEALPATASEVAYRRLGTRAPAIPVRLWASRHDDVVPYSTAVALAEAWGVPLETRRMLRLPGRLGFNHFVPYFQHAARDVRWLVHRMSG